MKYEKVIAERMRERQIENGKKRSDEMHNLRSGPFEPLLENKTSKRKELAKIANTSEGNERNFRLVVSLKVFCSFSNIIKGRPIFETPFNLNP